MTDLTTSVKSERTHAKPPYAQAITTTAKKIKKINNNNNDDNNNNMNK